MVVSILVEHTNKDGTTYTEKKEFENVVNVAFWYDYNWDCYNQRLYIFNMEDDKCVKYNFPVVLIRCFDVSENNHSDSVVDG